MWRPAVVRCAVLAGIATLACWRGEPPPRNTPIENRGGSATVVDDEPRAYWCSISDDGYDYPQMPCAIRKIDGRLMLAKLAGSQRFRGVIRPRGRGFLFDGELYCPWGDCTRPLRGTFVPTGDGALQGTFDDATLVVTLVPAPANSPWGGASYGGDGYGGFEYGGWGYGGATAPGWRRRP